MGRFPPLKCCVVLCCSPVAFRVVWQEGQESSIAYSKCKSDIDTMGMDMDALLEKVNSAPNTEGLGGIPGLFGELSASRNEH